MDLTEEQLDLMYEHYLIDTRPVKRKMSATDPDYDKLEQLQEQYEDPDFDDVWDSDEVFEQEAKAMDESGEVVRNSMGEPPFEGESLVGERHAESHKYNDEWEEV